MATIDSPTITSNSPERKALNNFLSSLKGSVVTVQLNDGTCYEGVYSTHTFDKQRNLNHGLRQAQKVQAGKSRNTSPFIENLHIDGANLVSIVPLAPPKPKGFATDTEISGPSKFGKERELVSFFNSEDAQRDLELLEDSNVGQWDQFATAAKMQKGVKKSKDFDFNDYSTPIDPAFYKKHEKLAATIAMEINATGARHDDAELEDNSCVAREERPAETATNKYVPPFRRSAAAAAVPTPEASPQASPSTTHSASPKHSRSPHPSPALASPPRSPLRISTQPSSSPVPSPEPSVSSITPSSATSTVKFKFNPNARSFALDPFAPEYVPLVEPEVAESVVVVPEIVQVPQIITTAAPQTFQNHARFPQSPFVQPQDALKIMTPALLPPPHDASLLQPTFIAQQPRFDAVHYQNMQSQQMHNQIQLQNQMQMQAQLQAQQYQQQQLQLQQQQQFQQFAFQPGGPQFQPQGVQYQAQSPQFQPYASPQFQPQPAPFLPQTSFAAAAQFQLQYSSQPQFRQPSPTPEQSPTHQIHQRFPNGASSLPMQPPYRQILPRPQANGFGANGRS